MPVIGADGEVEAVAGTTRDVTERKQTEERLRAGEERLRTALAAARMVAWEWTPADRKLRVSENAADVFGLPAGVGLTGIDQGLALLHPEDVAAYKTTFQKAIDDRTGYLTRYRLVRPDDGRVVWIEERGHTVFDGPGGSVRLYGVAMDVTNRERAEAALRASEEGRRLALDAAELGTSNIDPATNALTSDERFRIIFAGTAEMMDYEQAFAAIHPDDQERIRAAVAAATRPDDPAPYAEEYRVVHPDGSVRWVFAKGRANRDREGTGRLVSFDGTVADITARHQAEAALRASEERSAFVRRSSGVGFWYCDLPFDVLQWDELVKAHFHLPPTPPSRSRPSTTAFTRTTGSRPAGPSSGASRAGRPTTWTTARWTRTPGR